MCNLHRNASYVALWLGDHVTVAFILLVQSCNVPIIHPLKKIEIVVQAMDFIFAVTKLLHA